MIEAGAHDVAGTHIQAAVGSDIVEGVDDAPPYTYQPASDVFDVAVASSAAMDGSDGGWPVLYGADPLAGGDIDLAIDEDTFADAERGHTDEQVAYLTVTHDPNAAVAYAWDPNNRLEAVAQGTPVVWTNLTNTSVDPATGDVVKTGGTDGSWDASASSTETIDGDGAVSFRFRDGDDPYTMIGLNDDTSTGPSYNQLEYAIFVRELRDVRIYENGTHIQPPGGGYWFDTFDATDVFTIRRDGSTVFYLRNGRVFHESTQAASGSYVVQISHKWDDAAAGDVMIASEGSGVTRHVYDVAGQRVMRQDPDGTRTLYHGPSELRWDPTTGDIDAARSYPSGVRRDFNGDIIYHIADHQGTVQATLNGTTNGRHYLRYMPYGQPRYGAINDDKGFLGQTHDTNTSLVYLNNRYHDPVLGQFISVDPLVVQTGEAYVYGGGNPVVYSDPSGLCKAVKLGFCTMNGAIRQAMPPGVPVHRGPDVPRNVEFVPMAVDVDVPNPCGGGVRAGGMECWDGRPGISGGDEWFFFVAELLLANPGPLGGSSGGLRFSRAASRADVDSLAAGVLDDWVASSGGRRFFRKKRTGTASGGVFRSADFDWEAVAVSGETHYGGALAPIDKASRRFRWSEVGGFPRAFDSEALMLEHLANALDDAGVRTGSFEVFVPRRVCDSCRSIFHQFASEYPGVDITVHYIDTLRINFVDGVLS